MMKRIGAAFFGLLVSVSAALGASSSPGLPIIGLPVINGVASTLLGTDASKNLATYTLGSGVATALGLNLNGSGALVATTSPVLTTPALSGSSTGTTTLASANAGASNFTITFPAATGTVALVSGANVASVSNSDGTLTISPTTGAVVASINLAHANTWTGQITNALGTITTSTPLTYTATTNAAGTYDASVLNVTWTSATFPSYYLRAQSGGSDRIQLYQTSSGSGNAGVKVLSGTANRSTDFQAGNTSWMESSVIQVYVEAAAKVVTLGNAATLGWASSAGAGAGTQDTAMSRISAGIIGFGTGAQGSIAGGIQAATLALGGATIGSNALAVTGVIAGSGRILSQNSGFGGTSTFGGSTYNFSLGILGSFGDLVMPAGSNVSWTSGTTHTNLTTVDLSLTRDAANTLAQRNGANAQAFRVYNTFTDSSNGEWTALDWSSNVARLYPVKQGTGQSRDFQIFTNNDLYLSSNINPGGTMQLKLTSTGLMFVTDNSIDIGASGATRPRSGFFGTNITVGSNITFGGALQQTSVGVWNSLNMRLGTGQYFDWSSASDGSAAADTALGRVAAGVVSVHTSAASGASGALIAANLQTGGTSLLTLTSGALGVSKMTASASAPGAAGGKIELVCGTGAGTAKLIAYAGTSSTATTILDNIGSGVTGCFLLGFAGVGFKRRHCSEKNRPSRKTPAASSLDLGMETSEGQRTVAGNRCSSARDRRIEGSAVNSHRGGLSCWPHRFGRWHLRNDQTRQENRRILAVGINVCDQHQSIDGGLGYGKGRRWFDLYQRKSKKRSLRPEAYAPMGYWQSERHVCRQTDRALSRHQEGAGSALYRTCITQTSKHKSQLFGIQGQTASDSARNSGTQFHRQRAGSKIQRCLILSAQERIAA